MALIPGLTDDLARECLIRVPFGSFHSISSVSKSWNTELRSPDFRRRRLLLLGSTRPHFVLALMAWSDPCPTTKTDPTHWLLAFDPELESWTRFPPAPRLPFTYKRFCRVVGVRHYIVVVTGGVISNNISNIVQVFDLLTGQWRMGTEMPGPGRVKFGLTGDPVSQTVLVAGGESDSYTPIKSTLLYDVAKDTWTPLADMERERSKCQAAFIGGRFHVINVVGSTEMCSPIRGESLDHNTWQWGPADRVVVGIPAADNYNRHWVTWTEEGDMYCFRPWLGNDMTMQRGSGGLRAVAPLPVELMQVSCIVTWKGKLVVIGGPFSSEVMQHDAYVLDLKTYNWRHIHLPEQDSSFANVEWCCGIDL